MAITVYTKPACPQCDMTKRLLDAACLDYETADITAPEQADQLAAFKAEGLSSAPIVDIGDAVIRDVATGRDVSRWAGFRPDLLGELSA